MSNNARLHVVDALRGFAIVSIMLLHNIEHFDFYFTPEGLPSWMTILDKHIWDTLFFLFGGKSYAIFSLLFGLTFFIQHDNQARKGKDFRLRFAWRLFWLLLFGVVNSAFYEGDILAIYAILGLCLIPVARLSTPWVMTIAILFMLQPFEWYNVVWGIFHPHATIADPASWAYFGKAGEYIPGNSLWDTIVGNLTNGKKAVFLWTWEAGRVFQTISLFMFGMLAGRQALFEDTIVSRKFWANALIIAVVLFIPLNICSNRLPEWIQSMPVERPLLTIVKSWANMAFMVILVSSFVLLFRTKVFHNTLNIFSSFGRMSLSNYITQSILGSVIYYGFGLGLYKYTGATYCLFIGLGLAIVQGIFSNWWMKNHKQGPLETIWHKLTWINSK
jgi:uncharacterized protein